MSYTFGGSKKEEEVAKVEDPKDAVVDEAIAKLKAKSDTSEVEIQRLKDELAKLKANGGTSSTGTPKNAETLTESLMRTGLSNDFVDENGMSMSTGFYIVIGTFSSKDNASKFKDANIIKGYNNTMVVQNHKTKVYYVSVNKLEKQTDAEAEQQKFKTEYPDVWVQKLE